MLNPEDGLLYMKIGKHAGECLDHIIERKRQEIEDAGFAMWGYGGNTCHPTTMVQPFAREYVSAGHRIVLAMELTKSIYPAEPIRARYYSPDGLRWIAIPAEINVLGSQYALCIRNIEKVDDDEPPLDLSMTRVALGKSKGKPGNLYVRGRVDKACLERTDGPSSGGEQVRKIQLTA